MQRVEKRFRASKKKNCFLYVSVIFTSDIPFKSAFRCCVASGISFKKNSRKLIFRVEEIDSPHTTEKIFHPLQPSEFS